MTKKDYIIIAKGIGECLSDFSLSKGDIVYNIDNFCIALKKDNPRFDATLFTKLVCDTYTKYIPYRKGKMKPLLSGKFDITTAIFPVVASPKIDGIRCLIDKGVVVSRTLKPLPNKYIQSILGKKELNGLDGEIVVGSPTEKHCFNNTSIAIMSKDWTGNFRYLVFDNFTHPKDGFVNRYNSLSSIMLKYMNETDSAFIQILPHHYFYNKIELELYHSNNLKEGYEGTMVRQPYGVYKYGRSTNKEGILLKWKPYQDSEAKVVGFEELLSNENDPTTNALGHTVRSSHKENKLPKNTLGALIVKDSYSGIEFKIGTGFSEKDRSLIWGDKYNFTGKTLKYKFNDTVKDKPRHPVFLYWV